MKRTFWSSAKSAKQFGIGIVGLMLITLAAVRLNLAPGATSFVYLIVIVFVSLRAAFVLSVALSLMAVFLLQFYFIPRFASSAPGSKSFPFAILASVAFLVTAWVITAMVSRVRKLTEAQLTLRFEERLAERTRIARDLHDTFLQTIQGSKLVVDDALEFSSNPVRTRHALQQLSGWLDQATKESRAALHSLRLSATTRNDLAEALQRACDHAGHPGSMAVAFSVVGDSREMHPIFRDEVYRIAYEAIRNAHKHSNGSKLEIELRYGQDLSVFVQDNGVGIDPLIGDGRMGHFGLQGMRERAARIQGKLTIISSAASGTRVALTVPGAIAFSDTRSNLQ
jgi:signal transduction histidine kinase